MDVELHTFDLLFFTNDKDKQNALKEHKILRKLNHQNILKINDYCYDKKNDQFYVITNIPGQSLNKFVNLFIYFYSDCK